MHDDNRPVVRAGASSRSMTVAALQLLQSRSKSAQASLARIAGDFSDRTRLAANLQEPPFGTVYLNAMLVALVWWG